MAPYFAVFDQRVYHGFFTVFNAFSAFARITALVLAVPFTGRIVDGIILTVEAGYSDYWSAGNAL